MANPNFTWDFETLENESVTVIKWHGFFSVILICLCCIFAIISTSGKSMIIYFILYKAPKRPMNTMILLDQVNTLKTLSINNQNGIFLDWYIADQLGGTIHDHHFLNLGYTHTWPLRSQCLWLVLWLPDSSQHFGSDRRLFHGPISHALCPISKLHSIPGKIDGQVALVAIHVFSGYVDFGVGGSGCLWI